MNRIVVKNPCNNSFSSQFTSLYDVLLKIRPRSRNHFDFSELEDMSPLLLLPIGVFVHDTQSSYDLPKKDGLMTKHLFPLGGKSKKGLKGDSLPITLLSNSQDIKARDEILTAYMNRIYKKVSSMGKDVLYWPITEFVNNVFEHSKKNEGWIFAQIDDDNKYIDICIVDSGRGFKKTYQEEENMRLSHLEAIGEVMIGHSTKKDKERGFGVWTSKRLICKGLKGDFLLISGNALLLAQGMDERVLEMDKDIWNGVILVYRIPVKAEKVDIYDYVE